MLSRLLRESINGSFDRHTEIHSALGSTRAFQSLPRHLRRRAASHNPRRVPKRYRSRAAAEVCLNLTKLIVLTDRSDRAVMLSRYIESEQEQGRREIYKGNQSLSNCSSVSVSLSSRSSDLVLISREQVMASYTHLARQAIPHDQRMGISTTSNTYPQILSNCLSRCQEKIYRQ